jgi:hypothetical protein
MKPITSLNRLCSCGCGRTVTRRFGKLSEHCLLERISQSKGRPPGTKSPGYDGAKYEIRRTSYPLIQVQSKCPACGVMHPVLVRREPRFTIREYCPEHRYLREECAE